MIRAKKQLLLVCLIFLGLGSTACSGFRDLRDQAPADFYLSDLEGKAWASQAFKNQPLLLFFFSPACQDCLASSSELNAFEDSHGDKIKALALMVDASGGQSFLADLGESGLKWPVAVAHPKLAAAWGAKSYPYFVLLAHGKIAAQFSGTQTELSLESNLAPWLK